MATYQDPDNPNKLLQHTGFYGYHQEAENLYNQPISLVENIPTEFQLKVPGTGVHIIGFDTLYQDLPEQAIQETLNNFFAALLYGNLTVSIGDTVINQENLEILIDKHCPPVKFSTLHYYHALRDAEPIATTPRPTLDGARSMEIYIKTPADLKDKLPRRLAHINRRGMLITDSARFETNPFSPRGGDWLPWAAVSAAHDDQTDRWIRTMEPPAHDAVAYNRLRNPDAEQVARQELSYQRDQITDIIYSRIESIANSQGDDLDELKDLFPELATQLPGCREIATRRRDPAAAEGTDSVISPDELELEPDDDGQTTEHGAAQGSKGGKQAGNKDKGIGRKDRKYSLAAARTAIRQARVISAGDRELTLSLTMPDQPQVQVAIQRAGEPRDKTELPLEIRTVRGEAATLGSDHKQIVITGNPGDRVTARVTLKEKPPVYCAYTIVELTSGETAQ